MNSLPIQHLPVTPARPLWLAAARHAGVAAIAFSLSVAAIMIVAYRHDRRDNPLASTRLMQLKTDLITQPTNEQFKEEIRQFDLSLRQRHFERRAMLKRGGYLLLAGLVVVLICVKYTARPKTGLDPLSMLPPAIDPQATAPLTRRAIGFAAVMLGAAFALAALQPGLRFDEVAETAIPAVPTWPTEDELARNWPVFRGSRVGVVQAEVPTDWDAASSRNILWKTPVPLPGNNSPIVWNSFVFLAGATPEQQRVFCFNADNGSLLWERTIGAPNPSRAPKVMEEGGYAPATMATNGQLAFAIFPTGDVAALDFSGKIIWSKNLGMPENQYGYAASLAMWRDRLLIQFDQGLEPETGKSAMLALDAATGKSAWRTPRPVANSWASPIVVNGPAGAQIITASRPWVIAYEPERGTELWRVKCLEGDVAPSPAFANGIAIAVQEGAKVTAIRSGGSGDVTGTHAAWADDQGLADIVSPLATSRHVFLATSFGTVTCYELATGRKLWEHDFESSFHASPIAVGNVILLVDRKGTTHQFEDSAEYKLVNQSAIGEPVSATPAIVNHRIYIRGESNLYCIGSK